MLDKGIQEIVTEESLAFWKSRDERKKAIQDSIDLLKSGIGKDSPFSEEEKIYIRQAIEWLQYVQKRHPVNEEKLLKKFPKG